MKKYQKANKFSYTLGVYPTLELLRFQKAYVQRVILGPKAKDNLGASQISNLCKDYRIPIEHDQGLINKLAGSENCLAAGFFEKYQTKLDHNLSQLLLVNPSDMGNLGTVIRTMVAFGVRNLAMIRPSVDIFDPKVIRSSMGAIFYINFQYFNDLAEFLKVNNQPLFPFMTDGQKKLAEIVFQPPLTLVFGNEGQGLSDQYQHLGTSVKISQSKDVDSLNLAVSVGIAMYECFGKKA